VGGLDLWSGCAVFDPKYNILWVEATTDAGKPIFYGFDALTGSLVYTVNDTNVMMESLAYDPVTGNYSITIRSPIPSPFLKDIKCHM
jgi:hypothetical protein